MNEVIKLILKDLHPLQIVEEAGFREFVKALDSSCDTDLSSSSVRSELLKRYEETKTKVIQHLQQTEYVTLTADLWEKSADSYVTVRCHFLDKTWTRKSYILETTCLVNDGDPAHSIAVELSRIAKAWNIDNKITLVVSNVDNMTEHRQIMGWTSMPCFAFYLNSMFEKVFCNTRPQESWNELLRKCRNIVQHFQKNHEAAQKLEQHQADHEVKPQPLAWTSDSKWLSTLHMLEGISDRQESIKATLHDQDEYDMWFNDEEENWIRSVLSVLGPCKEVMKHMVSSYYSSSEIIPILMELKVKLTDDPSDIAQLAAHECERKLLEMKSMHWLTLSTALDPRFKMADLVEQMQLMKKQIVREMKHLNKTTPQETSRYMVILNKYLREKCRSKSGDPLKFWRFTKDYKSLVKVAGKYLPVVSMATPCERAFQTEESNLTCIRQTCLEPENVNLMLFLQGNVSLHDTAENEKH